MAVVSLCVKKIEEVKKRMLELEYPSPPAPLPAAGRGETGQCEPGEGRRTIERFSPRWEEGRRRMRKAVA
jgi:hypothetical protein